MRLIKSSRYLLLTSAIGVMSAAMIFFTACKSDPNKNLSDKISQQFNDSYSQLKSLDADKLSKHASDLGNLTSEQLQILTQIEYRVMQLDISEGMNALQSNLQALGKERWDCNVIEDTAGGKWRIVCKKYPLNYLGALKGVFGF